MTYRAADYFWDQNLIDLYDKVEPIKLSLTEYEAKLLLYKIEKEVEIDQCSEPFIKSICKKLRDVTRTID